jgi:hypothetical protein
MMSPHEVKLMLERKVLERGAAIVGVHSVAVEDGVVYAGFDLAPDPIGDGVMFFEFKLPALVSRADVREFTEWLASPSHAGMTVH